MYYLAYEWSSLPFLLHPYRESSLRSETKSYLAAYRGILRWHEEIICQVRHGVHTKHGWRFRWTVSADGAKAHQAKKGVQE
jgi:hypothetical protein